MKDKVESIQSLIKEIQTISIDSKPENYSEIINKISNKDIDYIDYKKRLKIKTRLLKIC